MIRKIVHTRLRPRHPWRELKFDELAEIYMSMSLRSFGFSLMGVFVPVFLYDKGVSLRDIMLFMTLFFLIRIPTVPVVAKVIGQIGPKHTIAMSTVFVVTFFCMLLSFEQIRWPLPVLAAMFTIANGFFFLAYHVDFSKIQHPKHGGKELSWLLIFEQMGRTLGPVIGGLLAGIFAPSVTIIVAIAVLLGSLIPLFMTNEPVRTHQVVRYSEFNPKKYVRDFVAISALNVANVAVLALWPLLIAVAVFTENTYEKLGVVIGLTAAVSVFSTHMYGKFIDSKRGGQLLRYGTVMNVVLMNSMALTTGTGGAVASSALGQPVLLAVRMPLSKGMYDASDQGDENFRIVYLVWQELIASVAKASFWLGLFVAARFSDAIVVMRYGLVVCSIVGLFMLTQRFTALAAQKGAK